MSKLWFWCKQRFLVKRVYNSVLVCRTKTFFRYLGTMIIILYLQLIVPLDQNTLYTGGAG